MPKYLIYYGVRDKNNGWDNHYYDTVAANNPTHAIQLAVAWIPGTNEIDVRGIMVVTVTWPNGSIVATKCKVIST